MIISANDKMAAQKAVEIIKNDGVIAFATDTIYGLAANASSEKAVAKLYNLKKRDEKKPIAIFLPDLNHAKEIFLFDDLSKKLAEKYLPGALTLVLKINKNSQILAKNLNQNNDEFLGFRIVENLFIKNFFSLFNGYLAVTSANISGENPALNALEVQKYFPNLDLIIDDKIKFKIPSTVVKIFENKAEILRRGALEMEELN
jgi:L-threonylcarbamoyladenylate synthase